MKTNNNGETVVQQFTRVMEAVEDTIRRGRVAGVPPQVLDGNAWLDLNDEIWTVADEIMVAVDATDGMRNWMKNWARQCDKVWDGIEMQWCEWEGDYPDDDDDEDEDEDGDEDEDEE